MTNMRHFCDSESCVLWISLKRIIYFGVTYLTWMANFSKLSVLNPECLIFLVIARRARSRWTRSLPSWPYWTRTSSASYSPTICPCVFSLISFGTARNVLSSSFPTSYTIGNLINIFFYSDECQKNVLFFFFSLSLINLLWFSLVPIAGKAKEGGIGKLICKFICNLSSSSIVSALIRICSSSVTTSSYNPWVLRFKFDYLFYFMTNINCNSQGISGVGAAVRQHSHSVSTAEAARSRLWVDLWYLTSTRKLRDKFSMISDLWSLQTRTRARNSTWSCSSKCSRPFPTSRRRTRTRRARMWRECLRCRGGRGTVDGYGCRKSIGIRALRKGGVRQMKTIVGTVEIEYCFFVLNFYSRLEFSQAHLSFRHDSNSTYFHIWYKLRLQIANLQQLLPQLSSFAFFSPENGPPLL